MSWWLKSSESTADLRLANDIVMEALIRLTQTYICQHALKRDLQHPEFTVFSPLDNLPVFSALKLGALNTPSRFWAPFRIFCLHGTGNSGESLKFCPRILVTTANVDPDLDQFGPWGPGCNVSHPPPKKAQKGQFRSTLSVHHWKENEVVAEIVLCFDLITYTATDRTERTIEPKDNFWKCRHMKKCEAKWEYEATTQAPSGIPLLQEIQIPGLTFCVPERQLLVTCYFLH